MCVAVIRKGRGDPDAGGHEVDPVAVLAPPDHAVATVGCADGNRVGERCGVHRPGATVVAAERTTRTPWLVAYLTASCRMRLSAPPPSDMLMMSAPGADGPADCLGDGRVAP